MDAAELMRRVKEYGADMKGIGDRFMGDDALYESCFRIFAEEPAFDELDAAVTALRYDDAFAVAHGLKGVCGNLGLTPCYNAVSALTESLRSKDYHNIDAEFAEAKRQLLRARALLSYSPACSEDAVSSDSTPSFPAENGLPDGSKCLKQKKIHIQMQNSKHKRNHNQNNNPRQSGNLSENHHQSFKPDKLITTTVCLLVAAVIVVAAVFGELISNYRDTTMRESAAHLTEIERELGLYVEASISGYWNATHSIVNSITSGSLATDAELTSFLMREREIWNVTAITLFTADGQTLNTGGTVIANNIASGIAATARRNGEYLTIVESTLTFVVPVNTDITYRGSAITAVSVVQDLSSFLDNMNINAFDGSALLYLTQSNGAVVSMLTRDGAQSVYNLLTLLRESRIHSLSDDIGSVEDMLSSDGCTVFLRELDEGSQYVISAPVDTGCDQVMYLFFFVPVSVANRTTDSFSRYITLLSIAMVTLFAIAAVTVFLFFYISRKRQFNKALAIREHMLDLLVQNTKSAFALLNVNYTKPRFRSTNAKRLTGETFYNLQKTDSGYRLTGNSGEDTPELRELNSQLESWDGKSDFRSTFIRNTSEAIPSYFDVQLFPADSNGKQGEFISIIQDVTKLYERQAATAQALAMAEQANSAKSDFLSSMSHDIRTPMNAIVNMTGFAIESIGDPETQRGYLDSLSESSTHLLHIINDVLDMSRIESGKLVISSNAFDLKKALVHTADIMRPLCDEKHQTFASDFEGLESTAVLGDEVKLSQILVNLLSNAQKFTSEGGAVHLTASDIPSLRDDTAAVRFTVEDTGIGLSKEQLEKIFEPFVRAETEQADRIEGTGLGLSICRSYVNAMGGTITCESEPHVGSKFTVELAFKKSDVISSGTDTVSHTGVSFAGKRCLLCEDNPTNRIIAVKLLERLGFTVDTAYDGQKGAECFMSSPPGFYDLIYMDVQMPVQDGYRTTAVIRQSTHPQAKTIPIIAMTANVFAEDIEKARSAGMNGHLGKPILVSELIEATAKVLKEEEL